MDNTLGILLIAAMLCLGAFGGYVIGDQGVKIVEVEKPVFTEKVIEIEKECTETECICPETTSTKYLSTGDELRDDFYEDYFQEEYTDIKEAAEIFALEELEDDEDKIIDHLKTLLTEELDEESVEIIVRDTNTEVTALGLGEDEDKSATVEFEVKVKYRLEEGEVTQFKKYFDVVYEVVFDEGEFDEEEVELISIQ